MLVAATSKGGVPSVPASTAQRIRFRTIGLMLFDRGHAKDVPLFVERFFRRRNVFKLLTSKFTKATEKSVFWEKSDPLTEKVQNFATTGFMRTSGH